MTEREGQLVDDRYEVLETLGHGGMGDTYKARDTETGETVVVKIPHISLIGDPATYGRYEREMKVGQRLQHPNIQRLVTAGHPGRGAGPYMVLDYIEGTPLRTYLHEKGPLPSDEAIRITSELAEALEYCHQQGVVHRDMKPENVLITPDGHAKLVDFGIALLQGARRLTFGKLSSAMGTPDYMAPEQVRGDRGDARTDVYALGVMLYEMLAGEVPYQGDNPLSIMGQHVNADPPRLTRKRPDVSSQLEAVMLKAMRRDQKLRFQSMAEFLYDLQHLDEVDVSAMTIPDILSPRVGPMPSGRLTVLVVVAIFAILALLGFFAEFVHRSRISQ